jgi:hypothetical protein
VPASTCYTIGYEKARLADVIATLAASGIATLIDVRDWPISRRPVSRNARSSPLLRRPGPLSPSAGARDPPEGDEVASRREWSSV